MGIDQLQREGSIFQRVPDRFPVRPGGLHHDLGDALGGEPVGHRLQRPGEQENVRVRSIPAPPIRSGGPHTGHHLVLPDVDLLDAVWLPIAVALPWLALAMLWHVGRHHGSVPRWAAPPGALPTRR